MRGGVFIVLLFALAGPWTSTLRAAVPPTIVVPALRGDVLSVYAGLHAKGFGVSVPRGLIVDSESLPRVVRMTPASGTRVAEGSVIALSLAEPRHPTGAVVQTSGTAVPSFLGQPVRDAYAWSRVHRWAFRAVLGPLKAGTARGLLANYVVSAERPLARHRLLLIQGSQQHPATLLPAPPSPPPSPPPSSAPDTPSQPPPVTYFQNPVYDVTVADPFVLDNDNTHSDYWLFSTGDLFPMLHSSDLVHWTAEGTALTTRPAWVVASGDWNAWAPSVLQAAQPCQGSQAGAGSGCYIMYYVGKSAVAPNPHCIGVATSASPNGPYTDRGPLELAGSDGTGTPIGCGDDAGLGNIDPSPFIDPATGDAYLYVSTDDSCSAGSCSLMPTMSVIPLSPDLVHASGPRVALFSGDANTWEEADLDVPTVEGPAMEYHAGTYYLLYSGGSWQGPYGMGYATSPTPIGPFTKSPSNPILASTSTVLSVGGGDRIVTGPHGGLWLVYHGRDSSYSALRMLRIDQFEWRPSPTAGAPDVPVVLGPTSTPQTVQP